MAATLDKDTVVKHSFWILAGCYVVLVLACLAVLATSVSDTVRKEEDDLKKSQDLVKGINDPKNDLFVQAYKAQDDFVDRKKVEVWKKAWETQKDMMTWPSKLEAKFQKYRYFGEPIDQFDRSEFEQTYPDQLKEVWEVIQPVTPNGEGVVQCNGSDWGAVLLLDKPFAKPPTKDDIWLAQEELWVKREMLRIIRDANQSVARLKEVTPETVSEKDRQEVKAGAPVEKDAQAAKPETAPADKDGKAAKPVPPAPKKDPNHKTFRNPYWEFDLTLAGSDRGKYSLRGKVTNISKRKQSLDTKFKVFLQDPRAVQDPSFVLISPAGLPLAVGESKEINEVVKEQLTIEGLFGIEQVLNWRTAAVKRLDNLSLMYPSSRTVTRTLKPPKFLNTPPAETSDTSGSADASSQTTAAPGPERGASLYGGVPGQATQTLSGLDINRYTDVSDQVRHMPVAMVVVVDEEHLPELLAAFVNSKLRIQITQYHWQHCRDRMNPPSQEDIPQYTPQRSFASGIRGERPVTASTAGPGTLAGKRYAANNPLLGRQSPGGGERTGRSPGLVPSPGRGPGPMGPVGRQPVSGLPGPGGFSRGPTVPGSVAESEEEQEDLNLLEVAVYGLASLYERYPPQAPKAPEAGTAEEKPAATPAANK